jgi:hypothetical protein
MSSAEPLAPRRPWAAALLLGTVVTPACVVLGWLAPRPLDAVVALPLVLLDIWVAQRGSPLARLLLLAIGIGLTWLFYVLAARLVLWRLDHRAGDE